MPYGPASYWQRGFNAGYSNQPVEKDGPRLPGYMQGWQCGKAKQDMLQGISKLLSSVKAHRELPPAFHFALDRPWAEKLCAVERLLHGDGTHLTPDKRRDLANLVSLILENLIPLKE